MSTQDSGGLPKWQARIWSGVGLALIGLLLSILLLVAITQIRILEVIQLGIWDKAFVVSMLSGSSLILLRTIGVLVGGGIAFAGLAVSFFAHEKAAELSAGEVPAVAMPKFQLITHSPGIIAIIVGAAVIVCSIYRDTDTNYRASPSSQPTKGPGTGAPAQPPQPPQSGKGQVITVPPP